MSVMFRFFLYSLAKRRLMLGIHARRRQNMLGTRCNSFLKSFPLQAKHQNIKAQNYPVSKGFLFYCLLFLTTNKCTKCSLVRSNNSFHEFILYSMIILGSWSFIIMNFYLNWTYKIAHLCKKFNDLNLYTFILAMQWYFKFSIISRKANGLNGQKWTKKANFDEKCGLLTLYTDKANKIKYQWYIKMIFIFFFWFLSHLIW